VKSPLPARHIALGQRGEQAAADYLLGIGWAVVARNWHGPRGEIDIIAQDGDTVVFVEVKARWNTATEEAFAQVSRRKQQALALTAEAYLEAAGMPDAAWRIDVIAVIFGAGAPAITHARDALLW
jgi:putative endonuclease